MIKPDELDSDRPFGPWSCRACDVWEVLQAAAAGDVVALRALLTRDPNLYRAEYWYTQPIHLAVRQGHREAVRLLLDAGADPRVERLNGEDLPTIARERGHEELAAALEEARARHVPAPTTGTGSTSAVEHPLFGAIQAGDLDRVTALLDSDPKSVAAMRSSGRRPLSSAVELGHRSVVRLLLERGADPNWPEGAEAPRGMALHAAARAGDQEMVELLLQHGADPNGEIDSSGSATFAAKTPELRALLTRHGGRLSTYDLVWLGDDEEVVRRVEANPSSANDGCGGVFAAACKLGRRELLARVLRAGARVPSAVTACRSYLWHEPDMLRALLESGMDPNLPDWQHATPLHDLCSRDRRGRPRPHRRECADIFLEAGATLSARDEDYISTPLGWAARSGLTDMVELLLAWGAPTSLPDDEPWATPLAWAKRRAHPEVAEMLTAAGA